MTQYNPISCDCIVEVESNTYLNRCKLHESSRDVKECYAHNLQFTNLQNDAPKYNRAKIERTRIRNL